MRPIPLRDLTMADAERAGREEAAQALAEYLADTYGDERGGTCNCGVLTSCPRHGTGRVHPEGFRG